MNRIVLYYIAAFLWGTPGVIIAIKGIKMYLSMPSEDMWWQMLIYAAYRFISNQKRTDY